MKKFVSYAVISIVAVVVALSATLNLPLFEDSESNAPVTEEVTVAQSPQEVTEEETLVVKEASEEAPEEFVFPVFIGEDVVSSWLLVSASSADTFIETYSDSPDEANTWLTSSLIEVYAKLRPSEEYLRVRCIMIETLGRRQNEDGVYLVLQEAATNDKSYSVREEAVEALACNSKIDDEFFIKMSNDPKGYVRSAAGKALEDRMRNAENWPDDRLIEAYSTQNSSVRWAVLNVARTRTSPGIYDLLLEASVDPEAAIWVEAVQSLPAVMQHQSIESLVKAAQHNHADIRCALYCTLASRSEPEALEALINGVKFEFENKSLYTSEYGCALSALTKAMDANLDEENLLLSMASSDWPMRAGAARALKLKPGPTVQKGLIILTLQDLNPEVRHVATYALSYRYEKFTFLSRLGFMFI